MPFPLTPFDSSLSIASPNAPPRTDHQAMPFPHNGPTSEPNKYKSTRTSPTTDRSCLSTPFDTSVSNASPNAPPTTDHFRRFSQRFTPCFHCFTRCFHVFTRFFNGFIEFFCGFTQLFHGLPNFQMVLLYFSMFFSIVLLDFSIILPFHSGLPKCTSEDGTGGNRYPTVTQLPPGT